MVCGPDMTKEVAIGHTCISVPGPVTETKDKNIINFIFSRLEH